MSGIEKLTESFCENLDLFYELRDEFPEASVFMRIRNFNSPDRIMIIGLKIPEAPSGVVHVNGTSLVGAFPQLAEWITQNSGWLGVIPCRKFIEQGDQLARLIGRTLHINHIYGSGRQEEANFKDYGPYLPDRGTPRHS